MSCCALHVWDKRDTVAIFQESEKTLLPQGNCESVNGATIQKGRMRESRENEDDEGNRLGGLAVDFKAKHHGKG
jgi:hypothetical protein